ncbi:hypothetical protein B0H14DRAFT_2641683 [Mycena olivaceomarginata]|nr:hypothetical protein B0H14DRAFT_2641683 [Mycena olivaceomarginata]
MEVTPLRAPDGLNTPLGVDHPPQVLDGITLQRFVLTPPPSTADSGRSDGASPPPPVDQLIVPDSPPIVQLGHGRRKGTIRDVGDLSQGLCGKSVSKDETDKVKRNRHGCETKCITFSVSTWNLPSPTGPARLVLPPHLVLGRLGVFEGGRKFVVHV